MTRFIEAESRAQATLFPERIEDYIDEENPVRAVKAFVDMLDLEKTGFLGMTPKLPEEDAYRCPAGEVLKWRQTAVEKGQCIHRYWSYKL